MLRQLAELLLQVRDVEVEARPPILLRDEGPHPCGVHQPVIDCDEGELGHLHAFDNAGGPHLCFRNRHALHHEHVVQKLSTVLHAMFRRLHIGDDAQLGTSGRDEQAGVCSPTGKNQMAGPATRVQEPVDDAGVKRRRICDRNTFTHFDGLPELS